MMATRHAVLICLTIAFVVADEENHHFADHAEIHNEQHIKQHLKHVAESHNLTEEQQRFHYFSMNDLNKDNLIDGNEIIKAVTHSHTSLGKPVEDEDAMIEMIDSLMENIDLNGDGFIDFPEFMHREENSTHKLN
ncbi:EF hand [Cooperia oncophora]